MHAGCGGTKDERVCQLFPGVLLSIQYSINCVCSDLSILKLENNTSHETASGSGMYVCMSFLSQLIPLLELGTLLTVVPLRTRFFTTFSSLSLSAVVWPVLVSVPVLSVEF